MARRRVFIACGGFSRLDIDFSGSGKLFPARRLLFLVRRRISRLVIYFFYLGRDFSCFRPYFYRLVDDFYLLVGFAAAILEPAWLRS